MSVKEKKKELKNTKFIRSGCLRIAMGLVQDELSVNVVRLSMIVTGFLCLLTCPACTVPPLLTRFVSPDQTPVHDAKRLILRTLTQQLVKSQGGK